MTLPCFIKQRWWDLPTSSYPVTTIATRGCDKCGLVQDRQKLFQSFTSVRYNLQEVTEHVYVSK